MTNLSCCQIGSPFNFRGNSEARRKQVADTCDLVCTVLTRDFVPLHIGVGHITRDEAHMHNTSFSKEFWHDKMTIIWNGMYKLCFS